jgi:hypothetical protein
VLVARLRPLIEIVIAGRLVHAILHLILPGDHGLLAYVHRKGSAIGGDFTVAGASRDGALIIIRIGVDPVIAGALDREGHIGSIHFEILPAVHSADADLESALRQPNLDGAVVQIQKLEGGPGAKTKRDSRHMDFRSSAVVGEELVAHRKRTIDGGWNQIALAAWLERYGARHETQPADGARRILRGENTRGRQCDEEHSK